MPIEFRCTHCQRLLRTADNTAGKQTKCPECGQIVRIPASGAAASAAPAAAIAGATAPPAVTPKISAGGTRPTAAAPPPATSSNPFGVSAAPQRAATGGNPFASGGAATAFPQANVNPYTSPAVRGSDAYAQGTSRGLDVGDVMDRTWKIYVDNLGQLILGIFVYLIVVIFGVLGAAIIMGIGIAISGALSEAGNEAVGVVLFVVTVAIFSALVLVLSCWIVVGLFRWILEIARGGASSIGMIFSGGPFVLSAVGAGLLMVLATTLGYMACILPGLFLALIFSQSLWLIIDRKAGAIESLGQSMRLTEGNRLSLVLLFLIAMGIGLVGGFIPFSFLFTAPFIYLMMAVAYLRMTGQATADMLRSPPPQMTMTPPR